MKRGLLLFWRVVLPIVLVGVIGYQLATTWVPAWIRGSELTGLDISGLSVEDEGGQKILLGDFKGQPVVMNFWASWCVPCRVEIPQLSAVYPHLKAKNKHLMGINLQESWTTIDNFRNEVEMPYPIYRDDGSVASALGISLIPALVIIDAEGKVDTVVFGFRPWVGLYLRWII